MESIRIHKKAAAAVEINSKIKFFGLTLKDLHALTLEAASKGNGSAAKYYMLTGNEHWSGAGNVKKAFKDAHAFDKANPDASPKRMDQYLIPDDQAQEIALKIQKDVRTISNKVIKYADLINATASQQAA